MARPAPAVKRTIILLKYLAKHPRDRFTLSEIARNLDMNKATVHAMLATLLEEGVLIRHPSDKSYSLGPALIGLGAAASIDAHDALELATPEMIAIGEELDVSCVATTMLDFEVVILARRDVNRPIPGYVPVGHRFPVVPPQAREFLAWADRDRVDAWIQRLGRDLSDSSHARYYRILSETRRLGYVILTPQVTDLQRLMSSLPDRTGVRRLQDQLDRLISQIDEVAAVEAGSETSVLANAVLAPVFGPDGDVILALAISGFPPDLTEADIARFTDRLVEGTQRITRLIHGTEPTPDWAEPAAAGAAN